MKLIYCLLLALCPGLSRGQSIRPLNIGDTVPDITFSHVINHRTGTISLSDYKGKCIILDFWATTCMSCIFGFPKSDSLQRRFGDSLQILLVNPQISRDNLIKVRAMQQRFITARGIVIHLPMALYDTTAFAYFPFRYLPNYVWIGSDGVVKAITDSDQFNVENISAMLAGKALNLPVKKDE